MTRKLVSKGKIHMSSVILITGATGNIGYHVVKELLAKKERVRVLFHLSNMPSPFKRLEIKLRGVIVVYKQKFLSYLKGGLLAGIITAILANLGFVLFGLIFGHEIGFIGQDRDTLYIVFIAFATFMAVFISSIIFYFLQRFTKKTVIWFVAIVILGFLYNTYTAEVDLNEQYKMTAHILHLLVSGLTIYFIPRFAKE